MSNQIQIPSRERREKQHFFINGSEVFGLQQISINYNIGAQPLEFLGMYQTTEYPNGPQIASISTNSLVLGSDSFINFTGDTSFAGYLVTNASTPGGQNFSFTSAYLTNYNIKCAIGQIPEISTEILAVGNAGYIPVGYSAETDANLTSIAASTATLTPQIASYSTIELNLGEITTNRLQSFQISIQTPRNPIYKLGSRVPYLVDQIYPITVDLAANIEINDYLSSRLNSYPCSVDERDISVSLNDYSSGAAILSYSFTKMRFQGTKRSIDVNSNATIELNWRGYIEAPFPLSSSLKADTTLLSSDTTLVLASYY